MADNYRLRMLTDEEVGTIYEKCVEYLSSKGMNVRHQEALKIFDNEGAQVDFDEQQVRFPRDIIEEALRTAPHEFLLADRKEGIHDCPIPNPDGKFYIGSITGANNYLDPHTNSYTDITMSILENWYQLCEILDEVSIIRFSTPLDVPGETSDIHSMKAAIENTSKHIHVQPYTSETLEYLCELGVVAGSGEEGLGQRPVITLMCATLTPFVLAGVHIDALIRAARYGIACTIESLDTAGATTPISIAGTMLVCGIEILGMLVMSQLIKPGTKVIGGPLPMAIDMLTGGSRLGSVEGQLIAGGMAQFVKEALHIPVRLNVGTDSFIPDGQSMVETIVRSMLTTQSGCDLLTDSGGLDCYRGMSPVQLIIENDMMKILKRVKSGIKVDSDTLCWEDILATVPGGDFLRLPYTVKHCREALRPELFRGHPGDTWKDEGSKDLKTRALDKFHELKKKLHPQPMDDDVKRELERIVRRADERLARR